MTTKKPRAARPGASSPRTVASKPRTLRQIENDADEEVERQLREPAPPKPLLLRPSKDFKALQKLLVHGARPRKRTSSSYVDDPDQIFSRAQARAIKKCLREVAGRVVAKPAAGWAGIISGPPDDRVGYGWERILRAADLFKADEELEVTPEIKSGVARFRRRPKLRGRRMLQSLVKNGLIQEDIKYDSPLARAIFKRGRPPKYSDDYIAEICKVYVRVSGKPLSIGRKMSNDLAPSKNPLLLRLLLACLAPDLFFEKGRSMTRSAIYDAIRRTQKAHRPA